MIVGILGGGQLARMLALAGYPLGLKFVFLDPTADACAFPLGEALHGSYNDKHLLDRLAERADVVTYEFENVPTDAVQSLSRRVPVYPSPEALAFKQDRLREKLLFQELGIPTPLFHPVDTLRDLEEAATRLGLPMVLKTRSQGYDGKGQVVIEQTDDLKSVWEHMDKVPWMAEKYVAFVREVSAIAVRSRRGETAFYALAENIHRHGILHLSRSCPRDPMASLARQYAERLLTRLDYVGVLALELFQVGDGLLANEFAPRVHNSGHWTIEGTETSQFENHLRSILGLPLGSTAAVGSVAMVNCIGDLPDPTRLLSLEGVHLHDYGKPTRPGRKVGHVTVRANDDKSLQARLDAVCELLKGSASKCFQ